MSDAELAKYVIRKQREVDQWGAWLRNKIEAQAGGDFAEWVHAVSEDSDMDEARRKLSNLSDSEVFFVTRLAAYGFAMAVLPSLQEQA